VAEPPGLYGPLLYLNSIMGPVSLTLDITTVHPVSRRGTEDTCNENAVHKAYFNKVAKHQSGSTLRTTGSCLRSPTRLALSTPYHGAPSTTSHASRRTPLSSATSRTPCAEALCSA
jgi:hypothetical protein